MHQTQVSSENQYKTQVIQQTGDWLVGLEEWTHIVTFTLAPSFYNRISEDYLISQRDRAFNVLPKSGGEIKWAATVEHGSAQGQPHLHAVFAGTAHLTQKDFQKAWAHNVGSVHAKVYDSSKGGCHYIVKSNPETLELSDTVTGPDRPTKDRQPEQLRPLYVFLYHSFLPDPKYLWQGYSSEPLGRFGFYYAVPNRTTNYLKKRGIKLVRRGGVRLSNSRRAALLAPLGVLQKLPPMYRNIVIETQDPDAARIFESGWPLGDTWPTYMRTHSVAVPDADLTALARSLFAERRSVRVVSGSPPYSGLANGHKVQYYRKVGRRRSEVAAAGRKGPRDRGFENRFYGAGSYISKRMNRENPEPFPKGLGLLEEVFTQCTT